MNTKIELTEQEANEFKLFRLFKFLANGEEFEYLQHQRVRGGRMIIHLKLRESKK